MSKRLIITEEERNEIRGKYNLMEQKPYASDGKFKVGDIVMYTPEGYLPRQMANDIQSSIMNRLGGKTELPMVDKFTKSNNSYVNTGTKIGLSSKDGYSVDSITNNGYYLKGTESTNTYIFIDNEFAKRFMISVPKGNVQEQQTDPFNEVIKEFVGKQYTFTNKYQRNGLKSEPITGTIKVITREGDGGGQCFNIMFTENIVPLDPLSNGRSYNTLTFNCNHNSFWHNCTCEAYEEGDKRYEKFAWFNPELILKLQQKLCIYI